MDSIPVIESIEEIAMSAYLLMAASHRVPLVTSFVLAWYAPQYVPAADVFSFSDS